MDFAWYISLAVFAFFAFRFVSKSDGISFKKAIGTYVVWVFVNLVVLVSENGGSSNSSFFPFTGDIQWYDFSEFLVYVGGPIVYVIVRRFFASESS